MSLTPTQLETIATSPQSASGDQQSVTARSADDLLKLAGVAAAETGVDGTNPQGGRKSAWALTRKAVFSPGGGS
jgi:hypothetical protein